MASNPAAVEREHPEIAPHPADWVAETASEFAFFDTFTRGL